MRVRDCVRTVAVVMPFLVQPCRCPCPADMAMAVMGACASCPSCNFASSARGPDRGNRRRSKVGAVATSERQGHGVLGLGKEAKRGWERSGGGQRERAHGDKKGGTPQDGVKTDKGKVLKVSWDGSADSYNAAKLEELF
ncbi:uncharacterized protein [Miscanthus floridulus]|uniref:uncharacterized protein n=1 Tax=Miscanthus floridulus TaxID=154761 RepID=UPI0034596F16